MPIHIFLYGICLYLFHTVSLTAPFMGEREISAKPCAPELDGKLLSLGDRGNNFGVK